MILDYDSKSEQGERLRNQNTLAVALVAQPFALALSSLQKNEPLRYTDAFSTDSRFLSHRWFPYCM